MNRERIAILVLCAAFLAATTLRIAQLTVHAQTDPTPTPNVETAVAGTLTALAPSPTNTDVPTATHTPSPFPTPTATHTPSPSPTSTATHTASPSQPPTLSFDQQVEGSVTAHYIDQMTLEVWVQYDNGRKHPWHRRLPDEIRASSPEDAEIVVVIHEQQRLEGSAHYLGCGAVNRYQIVYEATVVDPQDHEVLSKKNFAGPPPVFPTVIYSCSALVGEPPSFTPQFVRWIASYTYLLGTPTATPAVIPSPVPTDANFSSHSRYAINTVPVRICPNSACDSIGKLNKGDSFIATSRATDSRGRVWYSFTYGEQTVWVWSFHTSAEPPTD
jgi:hypothetical protein